VPPFRLDETPTRAKIQVLDASGLLAEAIRRTHTGGSIVDLMST